MVSRLFVALLLLCLAAESCYGGVLFSSLPRTLEITASPQQGKVLRAGEDRITVSWGFNQSVQASDESYKRVKVSLCYAPVSQVDRGWRKTVDNLSKDKTCQFTIVERAYDASVRNHIYEWMIEKDVPEATYFVRVYAYNSAGEEVAFGQTTDVKKKSGLFEIRGISGRHLSLEIASICFSAFSVASLFGFFLIEKRKAKGFSKN
ncbi:hypothetical protein Pint_22855 [Pistacia integerrima]|uniref:Uncharacterized protein n=1 Tax=Pistacia integerrima TaxID=434235 RepID=A0ACC0YJJ5_9ROSI|nr:hypothetical protein Pint_22855 [Pistacia integerrima]